MAVYMATDSGKSIYIMYKISQGDTPIDTCETYCYLGVLFTSSGSMKSASKALHGKALGAMFSLIRNISKHNTCSIDILLDLFDKLVVPIAMYNSEIWGTNYLPPNRGTAFSSFPKSLPPFVFFKPQTPFGKANKA